MVRSTAPELEDSTLWVTSAWRADSHLHSTSEAFDIRIKNVKGFDKKTFAYSKIIENWVYRIQQKLGPNYDVVYGTPDHLNHIHIEYDPK